MSKSRFSLVARFLVTLFAGAILVAPLAGIAHVADHHGAVDSVDCGTCHWSKNAAAAVSATAPLGIATTSELVRVAEPTQPDLEYQVSDQHPRGPPAARV